MLDETRRQQLVDLFATASELEPDAWPAFVERECQGDAELQAELLDLLGGATRGVAARCDNCTATPARLGQWRGARMAAAWPRLPRMARCDSGIQQHQERAAK
jgi:hypothetical protein